TLAVGISASIGASITRNTISSNVNASIDDAFLNVVHAAVNANNSSYIVETRADGFSGGALAGIGNDAKSVVQTKTNADITGATIHASNAVLVLANSDNDAYSKGDGGVFGALGVGAIIARVEVGTHGRQDAVAALGDNTTINAPIVIVEATGSDRMDAESIAGAAAAIAAIGADTVMTSYQTVAANVGSNVSVNANSFKLNAAHDHDVDGKADAFAVALGTGAGAGMRSSILGGAAVAIGSNTSVEAKTIDVTAANKFHKDRYKNEKTLHSGSFGAVNVSAVTSRTKIGTEDLPLEATIDVGSGSRLIANDDGGTSRLRIEAYNDIDAFDTAKVEAVGGLAVTTVESIILTDTLSAVRVNGAEIINVDGDVYLTANTDTSVRSQGEALVNGGITGAGAAPRASSVPTNSIQVNGHVRGEDVHIWAGRHLQSPLSAAPTRAVLISATETNMFTAALAGISVGVGKPTVHWTNEISVGGSAVIEALEDVNLIADRMDTLKPDAKAGGIVANVSLIPYGYKINQDGVEVVGDARVSVPVTATVRGGLVNEAALIIEPVTTLASTFEASQFGEPISDPDRLAYALSADVEYIYSRLDVQDIAFDVSATLAIKVMNGHTAGGNVGSIYQPIGSETRSIVPHKENYADTNRWRIALPDTLDSLPVYPSTYTLDFATQVVDKFFVIQVADAPGVSMTLENIATNLVERRSDIQKWMVSHAGNPEAIARYQSQLATIDQQLAELGFTATIKFTEGPSQTIAIPEFD
ncbi:hypothetical protein ACFL2H_13780, partial [Planctomycetota bacterium]